MFTIDVQDDQSLLSVDAEAVRRVVELILIGESIPAASIQVLIVDDSAIHDLNRRFLNHDEPTDVLSFPLEELPAVEGCVVASAETAIRAAPSFGWGAADELLLYVVHGTLHLLGYDDLTVELRAAMRAKERHYLALAGLRPRYDDPNEVELGATVGSSGSERRLLIEGARP